MVGEQVLPSFLRVPTRLLAVAALLFAGAFGFYSAQQLANAKADGAQGADVTTNVVATVAYSLLCLVVAAYFLCHI